MEPMVQKPKARRSGCIALVAGIGVAASAGAVTVEVEGNAAVGHTDNIDRSPDNERSATIRSLGTRFAIQQESRRLNAGLFGDLSWMDYSGDSFPSELTGSAAGRLQINLVDDRLRWVAEDRFGQTRRDFLAAPDPGNREDVNYLSTGPDLRLGIGTVADLLVGGRYTRIDFQRSPADSERLTASLGAERQLAGSGRLSANLASEHISSRGGNAEPSYDRGEAYLGYVLEGARSTVSVDLGGTRTRGGGYSDSGLLARLVLEREVGRFSRLALRAGYEYTDASSALGFASGGQLSMPSTATDSVVQTAQPYASRYVELGWTISGRRTGLSIAGGWFDENYIAGNALDRKRMTLGLQASYALGPRVNALGGFSYGKSAFTVNSGDNSDAAYSLALNWELGRRLRLEVSGEHRSFSSDLLTGNATESRYWLRVRYGASVASAPLVPETF